MRDTGARYQAALKAESDAWSALRSHFYDEMTQAYENSGDMEGREDACEEATRLVEALACATSDVRTLEVLLVAERQGRQRIAAEESKP